MSSSEVEESGGLVERAKADRAAKRNWFSRIVLFIQQVIAELKKVVTPTRKELINYTLVVIAFVVIMMAIVWALDQLFGFVTVFIFGASLG
ncbi:preprotein translocase subunit SecE [Leucobacter luti]|uniref:Protein translocase subunit SecE n=1 Tax=Leucobacter luti TaxID=340320 RepID=A0A4R6RVH9_9MICO|nr:preprotein translocase subunit SecE [Leucobacter luti]MCW2289796.1 preprotein translocase subunit SecE [Leucobacter luti]QYM77047.1 preprotein translocase subunit SecE [Leucobacter luti]TCK34332.1 preprotein translocase subunit SecE [Leucobacter luti]TDP90960.1 preprotein translocase subunit SecE [Leucobacter luti]